MQREYGGYLPLELNERGCYFSLFVDDLCKLNNGRMALVASFIDSKVNKVYLPYYNCYVVKDAFENIGSNIEFYYLDNDLLPKIESIEEDAILVYVNYFGITSKETIDRVINKYKRVIFDNTQAFFSEPIIDSNIYNVYSCRKFFGVSDGSYLIHKGGIKESYPKDYSYQRSEYLFKSLELGTNASYLDNLKSEESLSSNEILEMSKSTDLILNSIDYSISKEARKDNFNTLVEELNSVNELKIDKTNNSPFVYPLLVKNDELRSRLVKEKIYVSQWWKYLLDIVNKDSLEYIYSKYLLPLPIDQRYNEEDMKHIANIVKESLVK